MSAGVWLVPIALASIAVLLWAVVRFEDHVAPRAYDAELSTGDAAGTTAPKVEAGRQGGRAAARKGS